MAVVVDWECDEDETWTPQLEWRNLASFEEQERTLSWARGYQRLCLSGQWTFYQPMDLHAFPFDSQHLEITLVSNSVEEVVMSRLVDKAGGGARLHPRGDKLLAQAQWRLERNLNPKDPITSSFQPTDREESGIKQSYAQMRTLICVHRKWQFIMWNLVMRAPLNHTPLPCARPAHLHSYGWATHEYALSFAAQPRFCSVVQPSCSTLWTSR